MFETPALYFRNFILSYINMYSRTFTPVSIDHRVPGLTTMLADPVIKGTFVCKICTDIKVLLFDAFFACV